MTTTMRTTGPRAADDGTRDDALALLGRMHPWDPPSWAARSGPGATGRELRVVTDDLGIVVACAEVEPLGGGAARLRIAVDPAWRGRGLAERLLGDVVATARTVDVLVPDAAAPDVAGWIAARPGWQVLPGAGPVVTTVDGLAAPVEVVDAPHADRGPQARCLGAADLDDPARLAAVHALVREHGTADVADDPGAHRLAVLDSTARGDATVLVAWVGDEPLGVSTLEWTVRHDTARWTDTWVPARNRGRGAATALTVAVLDACRARGVRRLVAAGAPEDLPLPRVTERLGAVGRRVDVLRWERPG